VRDLDAAGAAGLVFFNRFLQTEVDIEQESLFYTPNYSTTKALHAQLRWTAVLRGRVRGSLAVSGGIHSSDELVKALLVGADVGYICSVLHERGDFGVIREILDGLSAWMARKGYADLAAFRGKLRETDLNDGRGFERMQYVKTAAEVS
jgi:dihydroorotate dehydrogenase (fumarate)